MEVANPSKWDRCVYWLLTRLGPFLQQSGLDLVLLNNTRQFKIRTPRSTTQHNGTPKGRQSKSSIQRARSAK
eukprot:scaffold108898_cov18-Tisochrysis_lutea.AAC.2